MLGAARPCNEVFFFSLLYDVLTVSEDEQRGVFFSCIKYFGSVLLKSVVGTVE